MIPGVCCEYCEMNGKLECPVKSVDPWSRWDDFCDKFISVKTGNMLLRELEISNPDLTAIIAEMEAIPAGVYQYSTGDEGKIIFIQQDKVLAILHRHQEGK